MDGGVTVRTKLLLSVSRTTVVTSSAEFHGFQQKFQGLRAFVLRQVTVMLDENLTVFMKNMLIFVS